MSVYGPVVHHVTPMEKELFRIEQQYFSTVKNILRKIEQLQETLTKEHKRIENNQFHCYLDIPSTGIVKDCGTEIDKECAKLRLLGEFLETLKGLKP